MRTAISLLVVMCLTATAVSAQSDAAPRAPSRDPGASRGAAVSNDRSEPSFRSIFSELGHEFAGLPSKDTAITLGVGGALALAVHPADSTLTQRAARSEPLDDVFEAGAFSGSGWVQFGAAFGTYLVGHATDKRRVQAVGVDLVQVQIVNAAITQGLKLAVRRTRPDGGQFSFPSGHSSGTFATAAVLSRHFGWKVGLPAYGLATYVAGSRIQENRHYASDVIFGAAVGIVAGRTVTVGRGGKGVIVSPVVIPGGAGVMFSRVQ